MAIRGLAVLLLELAYVVAVAYGAWQLIEPERLEFLRQWRIGDPRLMIILLCLGICVPVLLVAALCVKDKKP